MDSLRLIITDQCQYKCFYCPFRNGGAVFGKLTEERLLMLAGRMADAGIEQVEIAGGEPLLYPQLPGFAEKLKTLCGFKRVTVTTNGILLAGLAGDLKKAGIDGINIHIDTMSSEEFTAITGREQLLNEVLKGIWTAAASDIPVTITVGIHKHSVSQIGVMAGLAKQFPLTVRFVSLGMPDKEYQAMVLNALPSDADANKPNWKGEPIRPANWKGCVTFGRGITGAFGMEDAVLLGGCIDVV